MNSNESQPMKSPKLMFAYAVFLVACGLIAFAWKGFDWSHAKTAVIVSAGTGLLMVICGIMAQRIATNRVVGMIGIHAGMVLPIVYAMLFAFRAYKTFSGGDASKQYLAVILAV